MPMTQDGMGAFGSLAQALGITDGAGSNSAWFGDPMGTSTNTHGLATMLADTGQRDALIAFVDEALGPPDLHREGEQKWIPLFAEASPAITVYAVVEPVQGAVRVGVAVEHTAGSGAPTVKTTIHVPIFHVPRNGQADSRSTDATLPRWLLLGRPGGRITIGVEADFATAPPVPGEAHLGGATVQLAIPTAASDTVGFSLSLVDLQLPGASAPQSRTLDLDSLTTLGPDVLEFVIGMVRQQIDALNPADPHARHVMGLAGMLGLRGPDVGVPALPIAELPTRGLAALVGWVESILEDGTTLDAWLAELARLVGGTPDATTSSVGFAVGPATLRLGVRVTPGTGGHPTLVPWLAVRWSPAPGTADLTASVDLLRVDIGTGVVTAVPGLRAEAVFGSQADGGTPLLTGATAVAGLRVGIALDAARRPAFTLTLHGVDLPGNIHHVLLDLSSPQAAVAAIDSVVATALAAALVGLGGARDAVQRLLGIAPPANVTAITASALIADPMAAVRTYWLDVLQTPDAMADVLGHLAQLLTGTVQAPSQTGAAIDPWQLDVASGVGLRAWRETDATHGTDTLVLALGADAARPVLTDLEVAVRADVVLLRAELTAGHVSLASGASAQVLLRPVGAAPRALDLEIATIAFTGIGVAATWAPARGLAARVMGDGLTVTYTDPRTLARRVHGIPLPEVSAGGMMTFTPDWDQVEGLVTALLGRARSDVLATLLDLLGWRGTGAHLRLGALIADPGTAIEDWLLGLALDCANLRVALGPVAQLLSGGAQATPLGGGRPDDPYRCPIGGDPRAPGLAVWTLPGCPAVSSAGPGGPGYAELLRGYTVPDGRAVAATLVAARASAPDLADLLVGRPRLAEGIDSLITRWQDTDGVTGAVAPGGVTTSVLTGLSYAELVANGRVGSYVLDGVGVATDTVVHVGCEAGWLTDVPGDHAIDATGTASTAMPAAGTGHWFVKLPAPPAVADERPDHDTISALAGRLAGVLTGRSADVVLLAYGAAGAAAVRAAVGQPRVTAVVTVGTPWSTVAVTSLTTGLGGDAVRFLDRLVPDPLAGWTDTLLALGCDPLRRGQALVRRAMTVLSPADLPSAASEVLPTTAEVHAVFGAVPEADVRSAIASVAVAGIAARADVAALANGRLGPPTEVHVGVDLPVIDLDLGGLLVGVGARVDLVSARRASPHLEPLREVVLDVHLGITDGWLVGGPGAAQQDLAVRWVQARVTIPLGEGGGDGGTEIVLHEARAFAAYRESWVVRPDGDGVTATTALPEVKILLSEIGARIRIASPPLADLLTHLGILRDDGVDPDAIDHLLHDPVTTIRPLVLARAAQLADDLRALTGVTVRPSDLAPTAIRIGASGLHVDVDLAAGTVTGDATLDVEGLPSLEITLAAGPAGVTASAALGTLAEGVGGLRLVGSAGTTGAHLAVESRAPGATSSTTIALHPVVDTDALIRHAMVAVPAVLAQQLASWCRTEASEVGRGTIDAGLSALGLLGPLAPSGARDVVLPIGLFTDPGAWLRTRSDPLAAAVAVLEALAPVVAPGRPLGATGWPLGNGLTIAYAVTAGRLDLSAELALTPDVGGKPVTIAVTAGLSVTAAGVVAPLLDADVLIDGRGLRLRVAPALTLDLVRSAPGTPIRLHPAGEGLADAIGVAAESAVRVALNEVIGHRDDGSATPLRAVARALHELGSGLDLLEADRFTDGRIAAFVTQSPAAYLEAHLAGIVTAGSQALADALDPTHAVVQVAPIAGGVRRITFGTLTQIHLDLDATTPSLSLGGDVALHDRDDTLIGHIALEGLTLSPHGVQVALRAGPFAIPAGPVVLRPVAVIRAGLTGTDFTPVVGIGVGLDAAGAQSVEVRFGASGVAVAAVTRVSGAETGVDLTAAAVAPRVLGIALDLAASVLTQELDTVVTDRATGMLQGVVFTGGGRQIDTTLFGDFENPERLLHRLELLLWNCATDPGHGADPVRPLGVTIDGAVKISLASEDLAGGQKQIGLNITPVGDFAFPTSGVNVVLRADASWIDDDVLPGLSIFVVKGTGVDDLQISPAFTVAGVGVRITKPAGPLLELGSIALDGIGLSIYAAVNSDGVGGGSQIELVGLAVAPGGGGDNGVANTIMNDVGSASQNNRPSFSPALSVQRQPGPGQQVKVGLRAGEPPGPWWLVIQRQLGPLYVDRIGLGVIESGGRVTEISLLFSGQLSVFGLTAAVDRLSITWHGGDVLSISSWSVDLMGLAVSADFSGLAIAGGLLKTVDGDTTSYVGMLMGRFAAYGLSVFGGYSDDGHGHASFFIFGAINGPIGGPPAFFVTGLGGGLGINRGLVIPQDISRFGEFPFIQALDPAASPPANPMDQLHRLSQYFPHQMGNFWFAAGVSFTCFSLIDGVAVVAVSFGNGLTIDLLGLARMALPRPQAAIVSIELALVVHFSTSEGVFLMKAQLTDNSWLLYPDVRLTGGFAFALWWKGPLAGQFVVTMGGYHPSFHRDGYPVVPRLGIVWQISNALVVKGESYFALTSEALMAGIKVIVSLDLGWVWARVEFGADGIVYFDPFWFEVSAYARISAGIHIDLGWFGSISFSITLGASITVWGPDFAGRVEFEIGPCTVPIEFGGSKKLPPPIPWAAFVAKYLEASGNAARTLSAITGKGTLPTAAGSQPGAPSSDGTPALPFRVFAEFEITITTSAPATAFAFGATTLQVPIVRAGQSTRLGLSPMQAHDLTSTVTVQLFALDPVTGVATADARLAKLVSGFNSTVTGPRWGTDAYPVGVWGPPGADVPIKPLPQGDVVQAGKLVVLVAGIEGAAVGPQIDYRQVKARPEDRRPLPLTAKGTDRKRFLNVAKALDDEPVKAVASAADALALAAARLFAARDGLARGGHSAVARAAYRLDHSAPPMFGTLTDGLAPANADNGLRTTLEPPTAPPLRDPRSPFVAGHLTSGVGAVIRAAATTVADGRLKRRPAPTIESVQGRMALHLPVSLTLGAPPSVASAGTVLASGSVPRTDAVGSMRSYAAGPLGTPGLQSLVGGLDARGGRGGTGPRAAARGRRSTASPRADTTSTLLRSGDVVALQCPDAAFDVDETRRPRLTITGKARVTVLQGRSVLFDDDVLDANLDIPAGATHIGVHADGDADASDGLSGWHEGTRVARLGSQTALAAGCVVTSAATGGTGLLQWDSAGSVAHEAPEVTTRFSRPVRTVAVALTGTTPSTLDPTELRLVGGRVATDGHGVVRSPQVVSLGSTSVLVYDVVPDRDATSMSVVVTAGSCWVVSGVVGSDQSPEELATVLASRGMSAATAKVLAVAGPGCQVQWAAPGPGPAGRPRRSRATTSVRPKRKATR
ncbi:MAG: DUF6603 domain-containing protein [Ornithinibacter sp.]